jgi:hypothetical protein
MEETVMRDGISTRRRLFAAALLALLPLVTYADRDIRTERVQFKPGASSATIEGHIEGYETIDYVLGAREGQSMNVSMATRHGAIYFNILAPGENEVAMFNGSMNDNQYEGTLPATGDYKVRVYMMRSAARRNEVANYRLEMIVSGDGGAAGGSGGAASDDALVPGTDFHATGDVPCSMGGGQPTGNCPFGVKRAGNGSAMVTVTKPDGRQRVIFFENGKATGFDMSQADRGEFSAGKQNDLYILHIGEERYEIPDIVVFGD